MRRGAAFVVTFFVAPALRRRRQRHGCGQIEVDAKLPAGADQAAGEAVGVDANVPKDRRDQPPVPPRQSPRHRWSIPHCGPESQSPRLEPRLAADSTPARLCRPPPAPRRATPPASAPAPPPPTSASRQRRAADHIPRRGAPVSRAWSPVAWWIPDREQSTAPRGRRRGGGTAIAPEARDEGQVADRCVHHLPGHVPVARGEEVRACAGAPLRAASPADAFAPCTGTATRATYRALVQTTSNDKGSGIKKSISQHTARHFGLVPQVLPDAPGHRQHSLAVPHAWQNLADHGPRAPTTQRALIRSPG